MRKKPVEDGITISPLKYLNIKSYYTEVEHVGADWQGKKDM